MRFVDLLFVATIVYLPYEGHYAFTLPVKGLNATNAIVLVLLAIIVVRKQRAASPTPLKGRFLLFFFALTLSFLIGQGYDMSTSEDDLTYLKNAIFYMSLYFLFYHAPRDERSIRVMYGAIIVTLLLVSLQGVRQALDYGIAVFNPNRRITGPFGGGTVFGANMAAGYFMMMLPIALTTIMLARSRPVLRLVSLACIALGTFATFYTYSRQAYFALAALFTFVGVRRSMVLLVLLVILGTTFEQWAPASVMQRIDMTEQVTSSGEEKLDSSTESRFLLWQGAMQLFSERPWGIGLAHFRRSIGSYVPDYRGFDAHNGFVLITTETGILGIGSLIWLLAGLWGLGRRIEKLPDPVSHLYGSALSISVLGLVCANLFGSRIFNGEVMANFWAFAGLAARHYTMAQARASTLIGEEKAQAAGTSVPAAPRSLVKPHVDHALGGAGRQ